MAVGGRWVGWRPRTGAGARRPKAATRSDGMRQPDAAGRRRSPDGAPGSSSSLAGTIGALGARAAAGTLVRLGPASVRATSVRGRCLFGGRGCHQVGAVLRPLAVVGELSSMRSSRSATRCSRDRAGSGVISGDRPRHRGTDAGYRNYFTTAVDLVGHPRAASSRASGPLARRSSASGSLGRGADASAYRRAPPPITFKMTSLKQNDLLDRPRDRFHAMVPLIWNRFEGAVL